MKVGEPLDEGVADGLQLGGYHRDDRDLDTVKLVKTAPGSALAQACRETTTSVISVEL